MSLTISDNSETGLRLVFRDENNQVQAIVLYYPLDEIFDILRVDQTVFYHGRCYSFSEVLEAMTNYVGEIGETIFEVFKNYMDQWSYEPGQPRVDRVDRVDPLL